MKEKKRLNIFDPLPSKKIVCNQKLEFFDPIRSDTERLMQEIEEEKKQKEESRLNEYKREY